jgi:hypothetical protein
MRWVVELPAPSGGTAATVTVDADSWAGALTHARGGSPIKKFRCEFDAENVVRVLDLSNREWYTIRPIRAVTVETASVPVVASAVAPEAAPAAPAPQPFALARDDDGSAPEANSAAPAPMAAVGADADALTSPTSEPLSPPAPEPAAVAEPGAAAAIVDAPPSARTRHNGTLVGVSPARLTEGRLVAVDESGEHQALPGGLAPPTLLFQRDQDPSESNPLAYRERVFVVPEGTAVGDAELIARHAVMALRRSLATHPRGRYTVVAVFDHTFETRPLRPALVEVRWKDWRGDIEVTHPATVSAAPVNGAAHTDASGSVDVSAVVAGSASVPEERSAPVLPPVETAAVPAPTDAPAAPPAAASVSFVAAAVEAPVVAAPVVEASVVVAPVVEASVVVAPVVEAPVVDAPVVVPPVVDAPVVVPPAVEAPAVVVESVVVAPLEPTVATLPPPTVEAAISATPAEATVVVETPAETVSTLAAVPEAASAPASTEAPASAAREASGGTPTADVAAGAPPSPEALPASTAEVPAASTASEPPTVASAATDAAAPSGERETPAVVESARPRRTPRTIARRPRGKDLLGELFDALMDLSHMESADAGCKQVVQILQEHLQCDLAAVSLYDIDRDEFVVNSAFGADGVVGRRERAKAGVASTVVKRKAGITLAACGADDVIHDDFREGGGVFAPAMFRDRLFGLLRVHRVPGAAAFETDELDALSYVAAQLGEFLSTQSKRAAAAEFAPEPRRSQAPPRR